jgi:DNA-binding transcriptional regulator GbsR (MarR family)
MYRNLLIKKILDSTAKELSTNEIIEITGMTKQGVSKMMKRLDVEPSRFERTRGQYGLYYWPMDVVRTRLKEGK